MTVSTPRHLRAVSVAIVAAALAVMAVAGGALATHGGAHDWSREYYVALSGAAVVDSGGNTDQGDPDGSGQTYLSLSADPALESSLCWITEVEGVAGVVTGAHLHAGEAGTNGAIVATLEPLASDGMGVVCVPHDDLAAIQAVIDHPTAFYIDVHTSEFPDGALRGQVSARDCELKVNAPKATGPGDDMSLMVGEELWVLGDFLPGSEVTFDFRFEDGPVVETRTVTTGAQGEFEFVYLFEPGDEGTWFIEAVDGTGCTDTAEVEVFPVEESAPTEPGRGATTGAPAPTVGLLPDTALQHDGAAAGSVVMLIAAIGGMALTAWGTSTGARRAARQR